MLLRKALAFLPLAFSCVEAFIKGKAFDRFAVIWLENTDYDLASGDPNLAWLASNGILLTNHFALTHPSMPNYAAAISGDYYGINHDDMVAIPSNVSTIVDLLEERSVSWGEYQEDMPYTGFQGFEYRNPQSGRNMYVRKHNPAVLYDSVANKHDRLAKIKNLTLFYSDLEANALPQWMFITPNMTSDG
jgi:acid phosphatase